MAPSAGKSPPNGNHMSSTETMDISSSNWNINNGKEINQRPPVYNAEDYIQSLKKYGRRPAGAKSVYDTTNDSPINDKLLNDVNFSATLPRKNSSSSNNFDYRGNPIKTPPENDMEMSLRQFGSVTDLLTKLRSDLRASFPSFVQEFVASPLDGTSILLEVLRAVQLSQTLPGPGTSSAPSSLQRNAPSFQRRALLDELACLQCLSVCVARSPEAGTRLGTTPVGLLPLAAAATGQGIRARIIALQLLAAACDKNAIGNGTQKSISSGHSAVSEALSTLRLRCGEPVRFRLLVGMLNSGGGTGELQAFGLKFINTFLESADTTQNRLYLQAELFQAGFDPTTMTKTIASSSPWLEKLRSEVKRWDEIRIDIGRLQLQARESEKLRSQLVVLERRCQILQEEKTVLTSMERRLQERCAELQREVFRLQGTRTDTNNTNTLDKRPVALPRQVPPQNKTESSEHDDEGISSSETGPSLSPEPERSFPKEKSTINMRSENCTVRQDDEVTTTIEDVIEELQNIVNDAEREISVQALDEQNLLSIQQENEIVPVNLLPQPPRKSRSLVHLLSNPSDADGSDYGLLLIHDENKISFFDDGEYSEIENSPKVYTTDIKHQPYAYEDDGPDLIHHKTNIPIKDSNRAILNVIMDAREKDEGNECSVPIELQTNQRKQTPERDVKMATPHKLPAQHFNGVFFMTEMNTQRYPKPDITAALEAKRVTKNLDRIESYGLDSMVDIVLTSEKSQNNFIMNKTGTTTTTPTTTTATALNKSPQKFKIRTGNINAGLYSGNPGTRDKTRTFINGSKLTDLPSGLY